MASSTAPAAKAALLTLMQGAGALTGVQIAYSHPGISIQQECIYFGRTVVDEVARALGQQKRRESYIVEVVVDVVLDGDDAQACEERMWSLVGGIEDLLRPPLGPGGSVSANLGGAVNLWAVIEHIEQTPYIEPGQRLSEAVVSVRCQSYK